VSEIQRYALNPKTGCIIDALLTGPYVKHSDYLKDIEQEREISEGRKDEVHKLALENTSYRLALSEALKGLEEIYGHGIKTKDVDLMDKARDSISSINKIMGAD